MSEVIRNETFFFLTSVATGVLMVFAYDLLRIFRRVVHHGTILTGVEDLVYWCASALVIFVMIFEKNNGALRGFSLAGIILGFLIYHGSVSDFIVKWVSFVLGHILRGIGRIFRFIGKPFCHIYKKIKVFLKKKLKKPKKRLKKSKKKDKITSSRDK